jgi:hypothetical protein
LALSVFNWGLSGKLSQYQNGASASTISKMAKLTTERRSAIHSITIDKYVRPRITFEPQYFAALVFQIQGPSLTSASLREIRLNPIRPGRYNLHGPDLMLRPPPVIS